MIYVIDFDFMLIYLSFPGLHSCSEFNFLKVRSVTSKTLWRTHFVKIDAVHDLKK